MSTEGNRRVVVELFERFSSGDIEAALGLMTDDVTWWIAGKPDLSPTSGTKSREQIARVFHGMLRQLKNGMMMTVLSTIAEGDRVAVEVESKGELQNGRVYNNQYHFLITLRDGRISGVREYLDTHHVHATWFQP